MNIEKIDTKTGYITLTMRDEELRTVTNLLCKARKTVEFTKSDYKVNAELFTAITVLHHGCIPAFERKHINELCEKAGEKEMLKKSERVEHFADKAIEQYAKELHELMIEKDKLFDIAEKQKAEIENLKIELQAMRNAANGYKREVEKLKKGINIELENYASEYDNKIKAEAVKEFAILAKEKIQNGARVEFEGHTYFCIGLAFFDNLLKERVGDAK